MLSDLAAAPWAITPAAYAELHSIWERHQRGETADLAAIEARLGRPLNNQRSELQVSNGIAEIAIRGPLFKCANLLTDISGATSMQVIGGQLDQALADDSIHAILLHIDSPGGTVDGTQELADQVYGALGRKPITAWVDGLCASAAYWIASGADRLLIAGDTTMTGSIGVIATHINSAGADAQRGIERTQVTSGPLKGVPAGHLPLDATGRDVMQQQVDQLHQIFATAIGRNRNLPSSRLASVADGRILTGETAIAAGLVDGKATRLMAMQELSRYVPHGTAIATGRSLSLGDAVIATRRYQSQQRARGRQVNAPEALAMVIGREGS